MTIHIELKPDEERAFLERARLSGRDPVQYAQQIIRDHIGSPPHETAQEEATKAKPTLEDLIDHEFIVACSRLNGGDVPTIEEVREILAKIPGSLAEEIIADREDRF
ncbi:MAG: hypothetical protein ACHRXM_09575 [Isosphaerales bacterium]